MTNQRHISKPPNRLLWLLLFSFFMLKSALAADLVFDPATPIVEVGQEIALSVSGTSGDITWAASKGEIQGSGNQVTYIAPTQAGTDVVTVLDEVGNAGTTDNISTLKIIVIDKQLISKENANWTVYATDNWGLPFNEISALESDDSGGLWIGIYGGGLAYRSPHSEWTFYNRGNSGLADDLVNALESDGNGGLWIGTDSGYNSGLTYRSDKGEWTVYTTEYWESNVVKTLESDGNGGLWIGRLYGLAYRSANGEMTVYDQNNSGLPSSWVNALKSDGSGGLWIGTIPEFEWDREGEIGVLTYRSVNGEWIVYNQEDYEWLLTSNWVNALESDANGGLWIGSKYDGLVYRSVSGEWRNTANWWLPSHSIYALENDGSGGLWIGTSNGLAYRSVNGEWTVYTTDNSGLPSNDISALKSDGSGGLWIGTKYGGLAHLTFSQKNILPIIGKTVYHDSDKLKVTLPALPTGQVQYVGVALPDGTIFVLTGLNSFVPFDGVTLPVWQGGDIAIELPVSADISRGEYLLYLLRLPVGIEPIANQEQWKLGVSKFKIE